jgi:hypothetical protein
MVVDNGAAVCKVDDRRGRTQFDPEDGPQGAIQSADKLIEEKLAEQNLSEITTAVEERIRSDDDLATNEIDDVIEGMIQDAQTDAFADLDDVDDDEVSEQ